MLEIHTTLFIRRHVLQMSGQFLLQKFEVHLSCKMTFQEERTNQLIVQNCIPYTDTKLQLEVAFYSGVGILISPHMRVVCIINTITIQLHIVSKQDVMMQLATAIEPLAQFQPLGKIAKLKMLLSLHVVQIHALYMQCSPHSRVGNTKTSCNSLRTRTHPTIPAFLKYLPSVEIQKLDCVARWASQVAKIMLATRTISHQVVYITCQLVP